MGLGCFLCARNTAGEARSTAFITDVMVGKLQLEAWERLHELLDDFGTKESWMLNSLFCRNRMSSVGLCCLSITSLLLQKKKKP